MASFLDSLSGIPEALLGAGRNFLGYVTGVDALNELARQRQDRRNLSKALRTGDVENIAQYSPVVAGQLQDVQDNEQTSYRNAALRFTRGARRLISDGVPVEQALDRMMQIFPRAQALFDSPEEFGQFREAALKGGPGVLDAAEAALSEQGQDGAPADLMTFNALVGAAGGGDDTRERAARVRLGLDPRAASVRIEDVAGEKTVVDSATGQPIGKLSDLESEAAAEQRLGEAAETGKKTAAVTFDRLKELETGARTAANNIAAAEEIVKVVKDGLVTGSLADQRRAASRALATITGAEQSAVVQNTDLYLSLAAKTVFDELGGLGIAISDADRDFVAGAVQGQTGSSPEVILRLFEIRKRNMRRAINEYNEARKRFAKRNPDLTDVFAEIGEAGGQEISLEEFLKGGE